MRLFYSIILLLGLFLHSHAQPKTCFYIPPPAVAQNFREWNEMNTVDEGHFRVTYALNAEDLSDVQTYIDKQYLVVGDRVSKYYSAFLASCDSLQYVWGKEHPNAESRKKWLGEGGKREDCWSEYQYTDIFREGDEITVYSTMPHPFIKYHSWHKESYPLQQWNMQDDTLTVCGYLCQKVTCTFRGRSFVAWFAPDIPIGMGPWKFGGLPGLILKLYDKDRLYNFECVDIEQGKFPIKKYSYKRYKEVERKRLLKLQRELNEDFWSRATLGKDSHFTPYEPLELE